MTRLYMLDTDICSYLIQGTNAKLNRAVKRHDGALFMSAITYHELLFGAVRCNSKRLTDAVQALSKKISIQPWTVEAAAISSAIRSDLESKGQTIGVMDTMIAGSALSEEYTLVTNNIAHFSRISGLRIENWAV